MNAGSGVPGGAPAAGLLAPMLSLTFVSACLACIPWGAPVGGTTVVGLAVLGFVALATARFDSAGRWARITTWPVVLVLGAFAVSILRCQLPGMAIERSASMPLYAAAFLAVQACLWDRRTARALCAVIACVAVAMSVDIVVQRVTGASLVRHVRPGSSRLAGSHDNPNDMAAATMLLPMALAAFAGVRGALAWQSLTAAAVAPAWILSVSRQAFGAWVIGACSPILGRRATRRVAIGVLALVVAVVAAVAVVPAARNRTLETVRTGLGVREPIIAFGIALAADHPLTGVGPGLFGSYYAREALDGWSWRGQPLPKVGMPWVHCLPVEVACEYGLVGVCAFGGVAAAAVRRAWIAARAGDPMGRGVLGMLAAFLLIGLVDLTFIKDWVRCEAWVVAGVAFGLGGSAGRPAVGRGDRQPKAF